jgi:hypothetical protein
VMMVMIIMFGMLLVLKRRGLRNVRNTSYSIDTC